MVEGPVCLTSRKTCEVDGSLHQRDWLVTMTGEIDWSQDRLSWLVERMVKSIGRETSIVKDFL